MLMHKVYTYTQECVKSSAQFPLWAGGPDVIKTPALTW